MKNKTLQFISFESSRIGDTGVKGKMLLFRTGSTKQCYLWNTISRSRASSIF